MGTIRLRLSRDTVVDQVRCGPTGRAYAVLFATGTLNECPLAVDTVIGGLPLPRGTWILLDGTRTLRSGWLARDTEVQGLPCRGEGYKTWHLRVFPSGRLQACFLSRTVTIDGVPCRAGSFLAELTGTTQVVLHPNGRLHSCRLAHAVQREGTTLASGRRIVLTETGGLAPRGER